MLKSFPRLYKNLTIIYLVLIFLCSIFFYKKYNIFLARFPLQDLYWNDLQIYNSYRWFQDLIMTGSWKNIFGSYIDFFQSTGTLFATNKHPNVFLDLGAWISILISTENALVIRYFIFSAIFLYGIYLLNFNFGNKNILLVSLIFVCGLVSPIFYFEVGLLCQYFLFLTPLYFYLSLQILSIKNSSNVIFRYYLKLTLLILISLGVSDINIFFYYSTVLFFSLLVSFSFASFRRFLFLLFFGFTIFFINFFPFFYSDINGEIFNPTGSWKLEYYYTQFVKDFLFNFIYFLQGNFQGPITIYLNAFAFFLYIYYIASIKIFSFEKKNFKISFNKKYLKLFSPILIFIFLILGGIILHGFSFFRDNLPSAIRYHLSIFPFLILCLLSVLRVNLKINRVFFLSILILFLFYIQYINIELSIEYFKYFLFFLIIIFLFFYFESKKNVNNSLSNLKFILPLLLLFSSIKSDNFSRTVFSIKKFPHNVTRDYIKNNVDICMANTFANIKLNGTSGVYFISDRAKSTDLRARDDFQMFYIERPDILKTRTFNQWRYSLPTYTNHIHQENKLMGLFNFSAPFFKLSNVIDLMNESQITYLVSNYELNNNTFQLINKCKGLPRENKNIIVSDEFYESLYIYKYLKNFDYKYNFNSYYVDVFISNNHNEKFLSLPFNYYKNLQVVNASNHLMQIDRNKISNSLILTNYNMKDNKFRIYSFSPIYLTQRLIFLILISFILTFFLISFLRRK